MKLTAWALRPLLLLIAILVALCPLAGAAPVFIEKAEPPKVAEGGVLFTLEAPAAAQVYLAGDFNNWGNNQAGKVSDPRRSHGESGTERHLVQGRGSSQGLREVQVRGDRQGREERVADRSARALLRWRRQFALRSEERDGAQGGLLGDGGARPRQREPERADDQLPQRQGRYPPGRPRSRHPDGRRRPERPEAGPREGRSAQQRGHLDPRRRRRASARCRSPTARPTARCTSGSFAWPATTPTTAAASASTRSTRRATCCR
jgi:hypothetical protein